MPANPVGHGPDTQCRPGEARVEQEAKDDAWRRLGGLARAERGEWNLFALGTAYPLLRKRVNNTTPGRQCITDEQAALIILVFRTYAAAAAQARA